MLQISGPVLLFLIFMILKLTAAIAWSWWWVTSPLWISALLTIIIVAIAYFVGKRKVKRIKRFFQAITGENL